MRAMIERTNPFCRPEAMPPSVDLAVIFLQSATVQDRDEPGIDVPDRPAVSGNPVYCVQQMTWHLQKPERALPQWGRVSPKTDRAVNVNRLQRLMRLGASFISRLPKLCLSMSI